MSTLFSQARSRAPRIAEAAVERARLSLVPARTTRAPRAPFAVLVFAILGAGVVGLLMFNTHMQQASFYATRLQQQSDDLTARQQALDMELERLRAPQRLAEAAKDLGMVAPGVPAFVNLDDGKVVGDPTPASPEDAVRIDPPPAGLPAPLKRTPIIVRVPAPTSQSQSTTTTTRTNQTTGQAATEGRSQGSKPGTKPGTGTGR